MKKMIHTLCRSTRRLLILALLTGTTVSAQDHKSKMNLSREFPTTRETTLEIENKYGKIQVDSWDEDRIVVDVEIQVTESSASKLKKLKEDISIDFSGTKNYIIVKSKFESESGRLASELKSVSHTLSGSNKHVEINYSVKVPPYLEVVLVNKFGDIFMDDHQGDVDISLSNGALKSNRLEGKSNISLHFANGMIEALGSATLEMSYSDLTINEASQLDLQSKSSKLKADSINVLKVNSRRDKFFFTQVEYLYGESNFTEIWVYDFVRECDLDLKYGKLTIENVLPSFSKIDLKSEYADLTLMFARECSYTYNILYHKKANLQLADKSVSSTESTVGNDHFRTTGRWGAENPPSNVNIEALQKCYVKLLKK